MRSVTVSVRTNHPKIAFNPARNAAAQNGARVPYSASSPPISGPSTNPMPKAAPIRPKLALLSSGADRSAMQALAVDWVEAATPPMIRPASSSQMLPATAINM